MEARAVVFSGRCCSPGLPPSTRHRAAPGSWIFDKYKCLNTEGRAGNAMPGQFVQELHQLTPANNSHSSTLHVSVLAHANIEQRDQPFADMAAPCLSLV